MAFKLKHLGPGIVVAATGVGAGDMIAATVGGSMFGYSLLWAVIIGALLKYVLNEGLGRLQLASGKSLTESWIQYMHPVIRYYFLIYLILWSFIVAAALIAATGLAANSIFPVLSVNQWGIIHSVVIALFVFMGSYKTFENLIKILISLLFIIIIISVVMIEPDMSKITGMFSFPDFSSGYASYSMAVIGGVGGSVTLLSYGYWIAEKQWKGNSMIGRIRIDLAVAYFLTAIFGIAIVLISSNLKPEVVKSNQIIIALATEIGSMTGNIGKTIFLIGFWGAVVTSMLGVWQGIPYLFADLIITWKKQDKHLDKLHKTKYYKGFLIFLALPPIILLYFQKPVWLIMVYSVIGSLFMPFLAITLLWLTNKTKIIGNNKSGITTNILFGVTVLLFIYLTISELMNMI